MREFLVVFAGDVTALLMFQGILRLLRLRLAFVRRDREAAGDE